MYCTFQSPKSEAKFSFTYSHGPNRRHGPKKFNTAQKGHQFLGYSQLSNKSTGTMEKNLPKSLPVLTFSCGTIGINSWFLHAVLLFQRYYRVNFGRFKLEINRNEHWLLWKWYIKVSLIQLNLMCMIEGWLHWS